MAKYYAPQYKKGFKEHNDYSNFLNYNIGNGAGYNRWWRTGDGDSPVHIVYDINIIYGI